MLDSIATHDMFVVEVARSYKAELAFLSRLAVLVVVGQTSGDAHATRHRTRTPFRALLDAALRAGDRREPCTRPVE